jgi:outer membrane protein assembly factor BamB
VVQIAPSADWSNWRGPTFNGTSPEKDLPDKFSPRTPGKDNLIWKANYGCRSTPLVLKGRVYINNSVGEKQHEQERVMCLDADTGKKIWEYRFNVFLTDIVSARVGWTNLALDPATEHVYCHGTQGLLLCLDKKGQLVWERSLTEEFGRIGGYGGRLSSPIVDGDLVIVPMVHSSWGEYARGGTRWVACDKKTGAVVWWASAQRRSGTFLATPIVAVVDGVRLLIAGDGGGALNAIKVGTGERVWSYPFAAGAINNAPVVQGNLIYAAHGEINAEPGARQGRVICLDASQVKDGKPKLVWEVDGLTIRFTSPMLHDGRLYLNDDGATLHCLDAKTGKKLWKFKFGSGTNNRGSPIWAGDKIYVSDAAAGFHILKPGPDKCARLQRLILKSRAGEADAELDGSPAVANGRVYFSTNDTTFCIGKPDAKPTAFVRKEEASKPGKPAHLHVFPADVSLAPGESITFKARLFDDKGQYLKDVKAKWSLAPMLGMEEAAGMDPPPKIDPPTLKGSITADGKLTVPADLQGQFGGVVAEFEGLTGRARIRQYCKLPYKQDFEKVPVGAVPGGWVNAQGKFAVRKEGGSNVLVKLAKIANPVVARANAYIGPPTLTDYTIEADVLGKKVGEDLPDMGVVANRYTLVMIGAYQQLRLISWDAIPRIDHTIKFDWKPDVWYRMKLTVSVHGDKAIARGKVWERGKTEPEEWNVQVEDPSPNRQGSPALYANAFGNPRGGQGCEAWFDNVAITPNKK